MELTRRKFFKQTIGMLFGGSTAFASFNQNSVPDQNEEGKIKMGWKLGLQSYSLRKMPFPQAIVTVKEVGLNFVEAFSGHLPIETAEDFKPLLSKYNISLIAYGVVVMTKDEKSLGKLFDFAKNMGVEVLTADPSPDSFEVLDKLVEDYGIYIAIHNHGPGSRYPGVDSVVQAIQGHHERIGLCYDTGHGARAGDDIVEAVTKIGKRIYGIHLKDVNNEKHDCIVGTGVLDIKGFFKSLKEVGFNGALMLEYELEPDNPVFGIQKSLAFIRSSIAELG